MKSGEFNILNNGKREFPLFNNNIIQNQEIKKRASCKKHACFMHQLKILNAPFNSQIYEPNQFTLGKLKLHSEIFSYNPFNELFKQQEINSPLKSSPTDEITQLNLEKILHSDIF